MVIYESTITIPISLQPPESILALKALNKHHTGNELVDLDKEVSEGLKEATYNLKLCNLKTFKVKVYEDGKFDIFDQERVG